jgi:tetratricopeptide (TPR) repeat protein
VVYVPSIWGLYGWGSQPVYTNPYYVAPAVTTTAVYNYSQPVMVYNNPTSNASIENNTVADTSSTTDYSRFDECLQLFKAGNFRQALVACDDAITKSPNDPVMHEVRALIQFALGQYASAAAVLNSLLASSPGMDWTTMSSLYDDIDTYTEQLRMLEQYCKSNPKDAPAQFVLAYHYMVAGYAEEAADVLEVVVELQPKDLVAKQILKSLVPPEEEGSGEATTVAKTPPTPTQAPTSTEPKSTADAPTTDLVGTWKATEGKGTITLDIDENYKFSWKATNEGSPAVDLTGNIMIQGEMMILANDQQGNLAGKVVSGGNNKFTFVPSGSPEDYQGLAFERVAPSK